MACALFFSFCFLRVRERAYRAGDMYIHTRPPPKAVSVEVIGRWTNCRNRRPLPSLPRPVVPRRTLVMGHVYAQAAKTGPSQAKPSQALPELFTKHLPERGLRSEPPPPWPRSRGASCCGLVAVGRKSCGGPIRFPGREKERALSPFPQAGARGTHVDGSAQLSYCANV